VRPLHCDLQSVDAGAEDNRNEGLWYDKYCDLWPSAAQAGEADWGLGQRKLKWIKGSSGRVGQSDLLAEHCERRVELIQAAGGALLVATTDERLVSGLGRAHPVENGFAWHHALGVPCLPGSSIKGALRAWMHDWQAAGAPDTDREESELDRLLGAADRPGPGAGAVIVLDALPLESVALEADVMTPHYGAWYQAKAAEQPWAPGDWMSPNPAPFLTVAPGAAFLFGILPRVAGEQGARDDVRRAAELLAETLEWIGLGAKTAVGYGTLRCDPERSQRLQDEVAERRRSRQQERREYARRAALTPVERDIDDIERACTDGNPAMALYHALSEGRWSETDEIRRVAERIREIWVGERRWNPDFSGKNKQKLKQRDRCLHVQAWLDRD